MKKLVALLFAASVAVLPMACNTSSEGGRPQTNESFTISAPGSVTLHQGDKQTAKVTLNRGSGFKKDVKLEVSAPKGIKADLANKTIAASDAAEIVLTIEAEKDAPIGHQVVKVTGTPEAGVATSVEVKVKVEEKK
jgi:uncharacterized membrane protein